MKHQPRCTWCGKPLPQNARGVDFCSTRCRDEANKAQVQGALKLPKFVRESLFPIAMPVAAWGGCAHVMVWLVARTLLKQAADWDRPLFLGAFLFGWAMVVMTGVAVFDLVKNWFRRLPAAGSRLATAVVLALLVGLVSFSRVGLSAQTIDTVERFLGWNVSFSLFSTWTGLMTHGWPFEG